MNRYYIIYNNVTEEYYSKVYGYCWDIGLADEFDTLEEAMEYIEYLVSYLIYELEDYNIIEVTCETKKVW